MQINQLEGCCSVIEICYFHSTNSLNAVKDIKKEIVRCVQEYIDECFDSWHDEDIPHYFIATTETAEQGAAEVALKELGFTAVKFRGRHAKNASDKYLKFWRKDNRKGLYDKVSD